VERKCIIWLSLVAFLACTHSIHVKAQNVNDLHASIELQFFHAPSNGVQSKRDFIQSKNAIQPITKLAGGLVYFYQNIISEQLQADCSFQITCSEYIKLCIAKYGFLKGTLAGLNQYTKCMPANYKHHEEHKVDEKQKVINHIQDEL
jgi:putative component of membrane protein insertase Oxa1/YidC/SpoIIIJ protein YidD